ncbi:MAG TPA: Gfo/Idh/MocA family oxidoreductase [Rariglobus sp.]|jgi:predicted dehydrogenase|nr:Gfo/Idh/MocA family oxidoreductase [Rariglobus sp.]
MPLQTRRSFLKTTVGASAGLIFLPTLVRSSLFADTAPSKRIQIAQIGCGRMGHTDMGGVLKHPLARIVAVCDLDSKRAAIAKKTAETFYKKAGEADVDVKVFHDYRELLARPDIDAVIVSTPDHWHALVAVEAALAGKHLYVQKPVAYSIAEAIALRTAVEAKKVILQTGSQQRSEHPFSAFRPASEAVRNGLIGKLELVKIGVGLDKPSGKAPAPMEVPANLDYDRWLGPAPEQPYMEGRVHSQHGFGRPGWITTEDFGLGMITNWGAHHMDIAQWAMGRELGGPMTVEAKAEFMHDDVWTVHTNYHINMHYQDNVQVVLDDTFENGIRFEGSDGWVFCSRGAEKVTASDGNAADVSDKKGPLRASDPKILAPLGADAIRWAPSPNHYFNWIEGIVANRQPIAPIQQSSRSLEACAVAWIGMKLGRKLTWDPATEKFIGDDAANALRSRKARRAEFDVGEILKKAGLPVPA